MPKSVHLSQSLAPTIRAELARRGWTQAELASRLGISQAGVSERLAGRVIWDIDELARVAESFGIPFCELLPTEQQASA